MAYGLVGVELEQNVYELALERVRYCYKRFDHIAVSFSGGKDSTAVLNIVLEVAKELDRLPLHVIFFDEEVIQPEVIEYMERVRDMPEIKLDWYCVPMKHRNACSSESPYWTAWGEDEKDKWVREKPECAIETIPGYLPEHGGLTIPQMNPLIFPPSQYGTVGFMLGIRAHESMVRRAAVLRRTVDNYITRIGVHNSWGGTNRSYGNSYKVYPIYDWMTQDVWTAPKLLDWDYCRAYDKMELAGITHHSQRVAPPFGDQPSKSLFMWKKCWPELWDKMIDRVPGAATAARYAKTPLYQWGRRDKPDGISWPNFIKQELRKYDEVKVSKELAKRIDRVIRSHYDKAPGQPVLPYVAHPDTGLTWDLIYQIVARADLKGRIRPDMKMTSNRDMEKYRKSLKKYQEAKELFLNDEKTRN